LRTLACRQSVLGRRPVDPIYVFPTCVGVVVGALVILIARRSRRSLLATGLAVVIAGVAAWYVTLFTAVVAMLPTN